jgi:hypothetical protein
MLALLLRRLLLLLLPPLLTLLPLVRPRFLTWPSSSESATLASAPVSVDECICATDADAPAAAAAASNAARVTRGGVVVVVLLLRLFGSGAVVARLALRRFPFGNGASGALVYR